MSVTDTAQAPRRGKRFAEADWFLENLEALVERYPEQWLAIKGEQVRIHNPDVGELYAEIKRQGIERPFVVQLPR